MRQLRFSSALLKKYQSATACQEHTCHYRVFASHALPWNTHSSGILKYLRWLPTEQRIRFKLATLTHNTLCSTQPAYLHSLLNYYARIRYSLLWPWSAWIGTATGTDAPATWIQVKLNAKFLTISVTVLNHCLEVQIHWSDLKADVST